MDQMTFKWPSITLFELNTLIKEAITSCLDDFYWVTAEIAEFKLNQKGHCYLELIEKEDHKTVAQMKAAIWAYEYRKISQKFEAATGTPLKNGIKALFLVAVNYHQVYGLSLNIKDIDPAYTVGEMALRKKEIVERLLKEGLLHRNKNAPLPLVPQRIAVVSSPTAAGYGDFIEHLDRNIFGYKFFHTLFPALMQGEEAEKSIAAAFDAINKKFESFDVVALIRGGGSVADLGFFDSYAIAAKIAKCKLPVISGIGHEKDDTIADMAAHTKMKTPTAAAEFLVSGVKSFDEKIISATNRICLSAKEILRNASYVLSRYTDSLDRASKDAIKASLDVIVSAERDIINCVERLFERNNSALSKCEQALRHLDPVNTLKRGFSITRHNGKVVKDSSTLPKGAIIMTELYKGCVRSSVVDGEENDG